MQQSPYCYTASARITCTGMWYMYELDPMNRWNGKRQVISARRIRRVHQQGNHFPIARQRCGWR